MPCYHACQTSSPPENQEETLSRPEVQAPAWLDAPTARVLLSAQLRLLALRLEAGLPLDSRSVENLVRLADLEEGLG